jgi:hypothetical protein
MVTSGPARTQRQARAQSPWNTSVRQHWDDLHSDIGSAGRFRRDGGGERRGQRLRNLPAELAPHDDLDQRFVVSEQGYVDSGLHPENSAEMR